MASEKTYQKALAAIHDLSRKQLIDPVLQRHNLDALVLPDIKALMLLSMSLKDFWHQLGPNDDFFDQVPLDIP